MRWIESLLSIHGRYLKDNSGTFAPELRAIQRAVDEIRDDLKRLAENNIYSLEYLLSKPVVGKKTGKETKAITGGELLKGKGDDGDESMGDAEDGDDGEGDWIGLDD